mmetsp:Transcript_41991/g.84272  ORF Transcript_41991/g.84272 Transcript_41991/m.84272 type:complete len:325 (-) Transcript_41991:328-1302(-)
MAALILTLNQIKFCELHRCQPIVQWGAFPACKYAGVRFPGRNPFFEAAHGSNAFEYFFEPICLRHSMAQDSPPSLTCEQREKVHRVLPWAVRTYYYGSLATGARPPAANDTFSEEWYAAQRAEGSRLVHSYLRLKPHVLARLTAVQDELFNARSDEGRRYNSIVRGPLLGVHLRGTDKGRYLQTAGSGRPIGPEEFEPYVRAFLDTHGSNASVFVATDSPSYLAHVRARWPKGRVLVRQDVLRHERNVAFSGGPIGKSSNYRKGEEVLVDSLLLSRSDFLLHSASGVAEFAIYLSPRLHRNSVHLQYSRNSRQTPSWMPRLERR